MNKKRREKELKDADEGEAGPDVQIEGLGEGSHESDSNNSD